MEDKTMRMIHIHNPMHEIHGLHWEEVKPRMKHLLISPVFWAVISIAAFIGLLILLAMFSSQNEWYESPGYPYGYYPFMR
jgi:hypothetical protein